METLLLSIIYITCSIYLMTENIMVVLLTVYHVSRLKISCQGWKNLYMESWIQSYKLPSGNFNSKVCLVYQQRKNYLQKYQLEDNIVVFFWQIIPVAFVTDVYNDTYQCEVIKSKHLKNVFDSPVQSSLLNISLCSKKCKRRMHNKIITKEELVRKCVCLPEKRGLAMFQLPHEFEKK